MASDFRWAMRFRIGIALAPLLASGALAGPAQAQSADAPPADAVQQRSDSEMPRRYVLPLPADNSAPATAGKGGSLAAPAPTPAAPPAARPRTFEAASMTTSLPSTGQPRVETAPPSHTATPGQVEQLVQRSTSSIDFFEMVDDMLDEVARQLGREDPNLMSPMAIRLVRLSSNLRPEFARTLEARMVARVVNATNVKMTVCAECSALRSRVDEGNWIVTLGAVKQDDLRRLGETTGVKTFMDVDFTYSPESGVIWMEAMVFRASDGGVVWTDAYRSDGTMAALLRTGHHIPTRAERAAELEQKISARPNYGYAASLGMAQLGYTGPTGNVTGAQAALRFHEKFGEDQSNLFGLSAGIFTTGPPSQNKQPQALNSILLGAYYSHDLSEPNLNKPEFWVYGEGGGMFSGNEGNTFYLEAGGDLHLKWRLSLSGGVMYVFMTKYSGYDLGGTGYRLRIAMNW